MFSLGGHLPAVLVPGRVRTEDHQTLLIKSASTRYYIFSPPQNLNWWQDEGLPITKRRWAKTLLSSPNCGTSVKKKTQPSPTTWRLTPSSSVGWRLCCRVAEAVHAEGRAGVVLGLCISKLLTRAECVCGWRCGSQRNQPELQTLAWVFRAMFSFND